MKGIIAHMRYVLCFSIVFNVVVGCEPVMTLGNAGTVRRFHSLPNLIAANESSAIQSLRAIHSAEATFQATTGNGSYGSWQELVSAKLIAQDLVDQTRKGYRFRLQVKPRSDSTPASFRAVASPRIYGQTGRRSFYIDEFGVIRFSPQRNAAIQMMQPLIDEGRGITANEALAISSLRTIFSSEAVFQSTAGNGNFGDLKELGTEGLVDFVLAAGKKNGSRLKVSRRKKSYPSNSSFEQLAVPGKYGRTGRRSFYLDESGVLRAADKKGKAADHSDAPIEK